jgi:hypothetical protein
MNANKFEQILHAYYVDLYKLATPPADYDELVKNAVVYPDGSKEIDMDSYWITDKLINDTADSYIKKHKLNGLWLKSFNFYAWLGPVPRTCSNSK